MRGLSLVAGFISPFPCRAGRISFPPSPFSLEDWRRAETPNSSSRLSALFTDLGVDLPLSPPSFCVEEAEPFSYLPPGTAPFFPSFLSLSKPSFPVYIFSSFLENSRLISPPSLSKSHFPPSFASFPSTSIRAKSYRPFSL